MVTFNIKNLYELALAEGEGLGTAYEYFVKLRLLERLLKNKKINSVLIYGLPEKYGFSLDFVYFCFTNNLNLTLFNNNDEKTRKLKSILKKVSINKKIKIIKKIDKRYDLVLSSEVLQSLNKNELKIFIDNIVKYSENAIIFVPNKDNKNHLKYSGLNGFTLEELNFLFNNVKKPGYVDMPPFPPGLKIKKRFKSVFLIRILGFFALIEKFIPKIIKKYIAHINYVLVDMSKKG